MAPPAAVTVERVAALEVDVAQVKGDFRKFQVEVKGSLSSMQSDMESKLATIIALLIGTRRVPIHKT
jgi:hypothetical protein